MKESWKGKMKKETLEVWVFRKSERRNKSEDTKIIISNQCFMPRANIPVLKSE